MYILYLYLALLLPVSSVLLQAKDTTSINQAVAAQVPEAEKAYYPEEYFTENFEVPATPDTQVAEELEEPKVEKTVSHSVNIKRLEDLKQNKESLLKTFEREVIKSNKPVVVKYTATWCGPCQQMAPAFSQAADYFGDKIKFIEIDIDNCSEVQKKYKINSVPQMHFYNKGKKITDVSGGLFQPQQIIDQVTMYLKVK